MSHQVSTSIDLILAAFVNSLNVNKRLEDRSRKRTKSRRNDQVIPTTALSHSLQQSRKTIGQEYESRHRAAGPSFARGDDTALAELNNILIKLNTGLVTLINSFLHRDPRRSDRPDYNALISLSESSRGQSSATLRRLHQRIVEKGRPAIMPVPGQRHVRRSGHRRITEPTLAVVHTDNGSQPLYAIVKPAANTRKRTASTSQVHLPRTSSASSATLINPSQLSLDRRKHDQTSSAEHLTKQSKLLKQSSSHNVKSQPFLRTRQHAAAKSTPDLLLPYSAHARAEPIPPVSIAVAKPRHPIPPRRITPTMYSIATDSTKLGEIPIEKWAVPYDFDAMSALNRQAMQGGWPLRDIDGEPLISPKKRFGWFGLRKREIA